MLASLKIENVAVIEKAEVNFTPGFNVLTGETGAGKSILIDSINAILGNRTSRELVRSGAQKACIWATFESIPASVKKQLEKCGYEVTDDLLLYREINAEGKGMYEPSHGSAPDIAGKNLANPLATMLSAAMMLRYSFNLEEQAARIEGAVKKVLAAGYRTGDIYEPGTRRVGTKEMADAVIAAL